MTPTKLLIGQILVVLGLVLSDIWFATQWAAATLAYQPELGPPWLLVFGRSVYRPWSLFGWWYHFDAYAPGIFSHAGIIAGASGFVGCAAVIFGSLWRARQARNVTTYDSARWASERDIQGAGLFEKAGVFLGKLGARYLRHDGPEHVTAFAPTRSGKGVGLVVSTQMRLLAPACALAVASGAATAAPPTPTAPTTAVGSGAVAPAPKANPTTALVTPRKQRIARSHRPTVATASVHTVAAANRAATLEPDRQAFINAVQIYPYADGALYHVYAAPERVTDIALQPGEVLGAVASGDTVRWTVGDTISGAGDTRQTHILVKPFAAGLATNLVVTTNRRSYHLAPTSTAASAMAALSWTYPQDQLIALKHPAEQVRAAAPVAAGLSLEQSRFNYAVTGDEPTWRQLRAFDDGWQTFIEFPPSIAVGETPPLFLIYAKGVTQLVNYRVQGRFYVVDRIFDAAELRLGSKHQDIVRITRVANEPAPRRGA